MKLHLIIYNIVLATLLLTACAQQKKEREPNLTRTEIDQNGMTESSLNTQIEGEVNLGLSVNWAARNAGAGDEEQYGDYLQWDEAMQLDLGTDWRLPTKEEWQELKELCVWKWEQRPSDIRGYVVTGPNGNSIFLPSNGYMDEGECCDFGFYGNYWSSSESDNGLYSYALRYSIPDESIWTDKMTRDMELGIRAVRK